MNCREVEINRMELSDYDNLSVIEDLSESMLYQAINNVLSVATTVGTKIFCPFCVSNYEFKFAFVDHLKSTHFSFICRTNESFLFEQCPFCYANFFGRHVISKHVLEIHSKVISELYKKVGGDEVYSECFFCIEKFHRMKSTEFISHIKSNHFLEFLALFEEQFLKTLSPPKTVTDTGHGSKIDCFDFASMKKQLYDVKGRRKVDETQSGLKSILKYKKTKFETPPLSEKAKVCRVLQFDIPIEDKENSVLIRNMNSSKKISLAELSLLCHDNEREQMQSLNYVMNMSKNYSRIQPLHSSTPKEAEDVLIISESKQIAKKSKLKINRKPTFKSYCYKKDFVYQCAKCKKLFQENINLNYHIKKDHKMFILNLLHPCYQCAICKVKFFKNHYLKKHILMHSSYRI